MRHLVSGLIINKSISTTKAKAKEASRLADRLVTIGKEKSVANQRKAYSLLGNRDLVSTLFNEIAPLFKDRNGGYTRVMLTGKRRGDNAQMAILEFVEKPKKKEKIEQPEPKPKAEKKEKPKKARPRKEVVKKKEEPKKVVRPPKEPERTKGPKPKGPEPKPGFFKRLFGRKKET